MSVARRTVLHATVTAVAATSGLWSTALIAPAFAVPEAAGDSAGPLDLLDFGGDESERAHALTSDGTTDSDGTAGDRARVARLLDPDIDERQHP
ncbi:hypothetical protein [Streptomyces sp. NPDC096311]|uniref:hypothetical protein n=1 Tax=Streptomyces sp. NPDC096311 TaxID=3366083 RepID=UPI003807D048